MLRRSIPGVTKYSTIKLERVNAWPSKYQGQTLNAGSNDVPVETLEIVHRGLQLTHDGSTR